MLRLGVAGCRGRGGVTDFDGTNLWGRGRVQSRAKRVCRSAAVAPEFYLAL